MNCPKSPIYVQIACDICLTHFEIVSPLCWKCSCSLQLGSTQCAKCRKIASCSSTDVSFSPPSFLRSSKSFSKTCLLIPSSFLNLLACPSHSSSTHCCPLRMDVQSLKKPSQCFSILERVTWNKSNKLSHIVKIMYVILHHLGFRKYPGSCDLDQK